MFTCTGLAPDKLHRRKRSPILPGGRFLFPGDYMIGAVRDVKGKVTG